MVPFPTFTNPSSRGPEIARSTVPGSATATRPGTGLPGNGSIFQGEIDGRAKSSKPSTTSGAALSEDKATGSDEIDQEATTDAQPPSQERSESQGPQIQEQLRPAASLPMEAAADMGEPGGPAMGDPSESTDVAGSASSGLPASPLDLQALIEDETKASLGAPSVDGEAKWPDRLKAVNPETPAPAEAPAHSLRTVVTEPSATTVPRTDALAAAPSMGSGQWTERTETRPSSVRSLEAGPIIEAGEAVRAKDVARQAKADSVRLPANEPLGSVLSASQRIEGTAADVTTPRSRPQSAEETPASLRKSASQTEVADKGFFKETQPFKAASVVGSSGANETVLSGFPTRDSAPGPAVPLAQGDTGIAETAPKPDFLALTGSIGFSALTLPQDGATARLDIPVLSSGKSGDFPQIHQSQESPVSRTGPSDRGMTTEAWVRPNVMEWVSPPTTVSPKNAGTPETSAPTAQPIPQPTAASFGPIITAASQAPIRGLTAGATFDHVDIQIRSWPSQPAAPSNPTARQATELPAQSTELPVPATRSPEPGPLKSLPTKDTDGLPNREAPRAPVARPAGVEAIPLFAGPMQPSPGVVSFGPNVVVQRDGGKTETPQQVAPAAPTVAQPPAQTLPTAPTLGMPTMAAAPTPFIASEETTEEPAIGDGRDDPRSRGTERAAGAPAPMGPDSKLAVSIAAQLRAQLPQANGQTTEIVLDPEELGRVRMTLSGHEGSGLVVLQVERPETLDLIRRNIDLMRAELAEAGWSDVDFSFGQDLAQNNGEDTASETPSRGAAGSRALDTGPEDGLAIASPTSRNILTSGLDLRL